MLRLAAGHRFAKPLDRRPNAERRVEDRPDPKAARQLVPCHGRKPRRRDAPAVLAVWSSTELTRRNRSLEIGRQAGRGLGEHAVHGECGGSA